MAGDQAGQLQRLALADGVDSLRVAFLLDVAGQARVHDPHGGGGCKTQREKPGEHRRPHSPGLAQTHLRASSPTPRGKTQAGPEHFHHGEYSCTYSADASSAPEEISTVFINTQQSPERNRCKLICIPVMFVSVSK